MITSVNGAFARRFFSSVAAASLAAVSTVSAPAPALATEELNALVCGAI